MLYAFNNAKNENQLRNRAAKNLHGAKMHFIWKHYHNMLARVYEIFEMMAMKCSNRTYKRRLEFTGNILQHRRNFFLERVKSKFLDLFSTRIMLLPIRVVRRQLANKWALSVMWYQDTFIIAASSILLPPAFMNTPKDSSYFYYCADQFFPTCFRLNIVSTLWNRCRQTIYHC